VPTHPALGDLGDEVLAESSAPKGGYYS